MAEMDGMVGMGGSVKIFAFITAVATTDLAVAWMREVGLHAGWVRGADAGGEGHHPRRELLGQIEPAPPDPRRPPPSFFVP